MKSPRTTNRLPAPIPARAWVPALVIAACTPIGSAAQMTLLDADFDDKTPGVTIGTGGPAVGEPVEVQNISSYPGTNCYGSQCLVVLDNSTVTQSFVLFEHMLERDLDEGTIVVEFDLAVQGPGVPAIRLFDSNESQHLLFVFNDIGRIIVNGNNVADWVALQQMPFQIVYDFDAGFYDVYIDNVPVLQFEPAGSAAVYSIMFQDGDSNTEGYFLLDNLKIIDLSETYTSVPHGGRSLSLVAAPNPFRTETAIGFTTPAAGSASLSIYDVAGRLVRTLTKGSRPGGSHVVHWDGCDANGRQVGAGVYFGRLESGERARTRRITLVR